MIMDIGNDDALIMARLVSFMSEMTPSVIINST